MEKHEARIAISKFLNTLYSDDDILEMRFIGEGVLPDGKKRFPFSVFAPKRNWVKDNGGKGMRFLKRNNEGYDKEVGTDYLIEQNALGYNDYVGVNPRRSQKLGDHVILKGDAEGVEKIVAAYADVDNIEPSECLKVCRDIGIEPTVIVQTNEQVFGSHLYLKLETPRVIPVGPEGEKVRTQWEDINRRFIEVFSRKGWKSDRVQDLPRVLRIPGVLNVPTEKKAKSGRLLSLCTLAHVNESALYDYETLDRLLPQLSKAVKQSECVWDGESHNPVPAAPTNVELIPIEERRHQAERYWEKALTSRPICGRSELGKRNFDDILLLCNDFALPVNVALDMIKAKGGDISTNVNELNRILSAYPRSQKGNKLWESSVPKPAPLIPKFDDEPATQREFQELPPPPSDDELRTIYKGTPFGAVVDAVYETEPKIKPILAVTGALIMQSALLTPCIRIREKKPNCYAGLVAPPARGKGTVAGLVQNFLRIKSVREIDISSQKTLLKSAGPNPWGVMVAGEFEPFCNPKSWQYQAISVWNDLYDAGHVSLSSEKTGACGIENAAPSMLGCIHPQRFQDCGMALLKNNGFLSRMLLGWDDEKTPDFVTLGAPGQHEDVPVDAICAEFERFYSWLPPRMTPAYEDPTKKGYFKHDIAVANITVNRHVSLWETHKFESSVRSEMTRWVKNYLPLLSIPFETRENLEKHVLTAEAQKKGERVLLAYYWALVRAVREIPDNEGETLIRRCISHVERSGREVSRREIQQSIHHNSTKDLEVALQVIADRSLLSVRVVQNRNKTFSFFYKSHDLDAPPVSKAHTASPVVAAEPVRAVKATQLRVEIVEESLEPEIAEYVLPEAAEDIFSPIPEELQPLYAGELVI